MISTAILQFVMGLVAILIRYWDTNSLRCYFWRCVPRCFSWILCLITCGISSLCAMGVRCIRGAWSRFTGGAGSQNFLPTISGDERALETTQDPVPDASIENDTVPMFCKRFFVVRWYWFLMAGQVGFMAREFMVITMLDGWYSEVIIANAAMWLVIMLIGRQIWNFSYVWHARPTDIDAVLDMLLLPMNYGFLCALCVRILKLEDTSQNRMIALAMIDSADIWESWALWSVLQLFVKIVDHASHRHVREADRDFEAGRSAQEAVKARAAQTKHNNMQQAEGCGLSTVTEDLHKNGPISGQSWSNAGPTSPAAYISPSQATDIVGTYSTKVLASDCVDRLGNPRDEKPSTASNFDASRPPRESCDVHDQEMAMTGKCTGENADREAIPARIAEPDLSTLTSNHVPVHPQGTCKHLVGLPSGQSASSEGEAMGRVKSSACQSPPDTPGACPKKILQVSSQDDLPTSALEEKLLGAQASSDLDVGSPARDNSDVHRQERASARHFIHDNPEKEATITSLDAPTLSFNHVSAQHDNEDIEEASTHSARLSPGQSALREGEATGGVTSPACRFPQFLSNTSGTCPNQVLQASSHEDQWKSSTDKLLDPATSCELEVSSPLRESCGVHNQEMATAGQLSGQCADGEGIPAGIAEPDLSTLTSNHAPVQHDFEELKGSFKHSAGLLSGQSASSEGEATVQVTSSACLSQPLLSSDTPGTCAKKILQVSSHEDQLRSSLKERLLGAQPPSDFDVSSPPGESSDVHTPCIARAAQLAGENSGREGDPAKDSEHVCEELQRKSKHSAGLVSRLSVSSPEEAVGKPCSSGSRFGALLSLDTSKKLAEASHKLLSPNSTSGLDMTSDPRENSDGHSCPRERSMSNGCTEGAEAVSPKMAASALLEAKPAKPIPSGRMPGEGTASLIPSAIRYSASTEVSPRKGTSSVPLSFTTGARYLEVVSAFQKLSLRGVQAWVYILLGANIMEIIVKGILDPNVPTLCFFIYKNCMSCNDWYNLHIYPVSQGVIYILCSFALIFVFAFESVFHDDLARIDPYWKFWGVKLVVSVTYFQWVVLEHVFCLDDSTTYLLHCLFCCIEMPLLCLLHATCSYPFGKKWMIELLKSEGDEASLDILCAGSNPSGGFCGHCTWYLRMFGYLVGAVFYCILSTRVVNFILPPEIDLASYQTLYNWTCWSQSLHDFEGDHIHEHWQVDPASGALAWLPLCGTAPVGCALGYRGDPMVTCTATGKYVVDGSCSIVGCGTPPKIPHALPQINMYGAEEGWTSGMRVSYQCDDGYQGTPYAECVTGVWQKHEGCTIIGCGALQSYLGETFTSGWKHIMYMDANSPPVNLTSSYAGEEAYFTCRPGYRGKPIYRCNGGQWSVTDACEEFATPLLCRCKTSWPFCVGWFGSQCSEQHGCSATAGQPYAWCEVIPGSCPASALGFLHAEPTWDFCVADNFNISWPNNRISNQGPTARHLSLALSFVLVAIVIFLSARSFHKVAIDKCVSVAQLVRQGASAVQRKASRLSGLSRRMRRIVTWRCQVSWRSARASFEGWCTSMFVAASALRTRVVEAVHWSCQCVGNAPAITAIKTQVQDFVGMGNSIWHGLRSTPQHVLQRIRNVRCRGTSVNGTITEPLINEVCSMEPDHRVTHSHREMKQEPKAFLWRIKACRFLQQLLKRLPWRRHREPRVPPQPEAEPALHVVTEDGAALGGG